MTLDLTVKSFESEARESVLSFEMEPLNVTYPNGGEDLTLPDDITVKWTSSGTGVDTVNINLLKSGSLTSILASGVPNNGQSAVTLTQAIPEGTDYRIQVADAEGIGMEDTSDYNFSIKHKDPVNNPEGLLAHWSMDDNGSSTAVLDSVLGNNGLAQRNTNLLTTNGVVDNALMFNGSSDYVDLTGLGSTLDIEHITVSLWTKPDFVTGTENWILGNGGQFKIGFVNGEVLFWIREHGYGGKSQIAGGSVSAGKWYHIVGTYDGTYHKLYINNVEVASASPGLSGLDCGSDNFAIGKPYSNSSEHFAGIIDEVKIFNEALTQTEIENLYEYVPEPAAVNGPARSQAAKEPT